MKHKTVEKTSLKILYLEDSPRDVEIIREQLMDAGYDLSMDCTEKKKEYVSLLRSRTYDVILTNFKLAEFDAFGALRLAKEICPEVPFICLSESIGEETAIELIKQGAVDYVLKDRMVRISSAIKRALDEVKEKEARRRAEEALNESEQRFHRLFVASPDALMLIDPSDPAVDWPIVECNEIACRMNGYRREELIGKSIDILNISMATPQEHAAYLERIRREGVSHLESFHRHRDGHVFPIELSTSIITFKGHELILGIDRDITERKRAEEALRNNERKLAEVNRMLQLVMDTIPVRIFWKNKNLEYLGCNRLFAEDAGRKTPAELIGDNDYNMGWHEQAEIYRNDDTEVIRSGKAKLAYEEPQTTPDGKQIWLRTSKIPLLDSENQIVGIMGTYEDITERKRAEEALTYERNLLKALMDTLPDHVYFKDKESRFLRISRSLATAFGLDDPAQAVGKTDFDFFTEDHARPAFEDEQKIMESGVAIVGLEEKEYWPDGRQSWVSTTKVPLQNAQGEIIGTFGISRDITERKRAEETLRESEDRYQRITEAITDYIYTVRVVDGRVAETTHGLGCMTVTGYQTNEYANDPFLWFNMVVAEDRPKVEEQARRILAGEDPPPIEHRIIHKNGSVRWVRNTFVLHRDENGAITAYDGLIQDITERKRAEEALTYERNLLKALMDTMPDHVYFKDKESRFLGISKSLANAFGLDDPAQAVGKTDFDFFTEDHARPAFEDEQKIMESGVAIVGLEEKEYWPDGRQSWVSTTKVPLQNAQGEIIGTFGISRDITERKQAEEAVRESEERFRMVFENVFDGICIHDEDPDPTKRKLIDCNEQYAAMAGRSREELLRLGNTQALMITLESTANINRLESLAKGTAYRGSFSWIRPDGKENIVEYVGVPVTWRGKSYSIGIDRDITERKKAAEALSRSEERYRLLHEYAPVGILLTNRSGQILEVNPAALQILGSPSAEETKGINLLTFPLLIKAGISAAYQRCIETGQASFGEYPYVSKWGKPIHMQLRFVPILDDHNEVTLVHIIIEDVTERKRVEEELHKLSLAVKQSPASIVITDTQGNIEYVNPKFTQVTGYTLEEARGKNPRILKSGETSLEEYKRLWDTITAGKEWRGEFHNKKKNGELFWEMASISPVKNVDNVIANFVAVKEDITERKRVEEALRHAQKLESIGTLAGGIAHDFNNLLNAVLGQSVLALRKLPKESPAGSNVTKAINAAERAADLTRQLLAYSGKGKFVTEEFDLNRLVEENAQLLEVSVPKTAQLQYELDSSILCIHGDVGQIQQVVMNLIINAGEAMGPTPGYITIHTGRIKLTENDTEYWKHTNNPLTPGEYALLQVSDTGHGIRPDVLARIFDPFFTTKFTGRGLGLAAVLGIIRGHHGGVRIESDEGKGTVFEIVFPLVDASTMSDVREKREERAVVGDGKTVLVIDDEPSVLELLKDIFTEAKFTVLEASNPIEGIELYRRHQRGVAMVLLDYSMPGMDGKATFGELLKINKDVQVLFSSGYTEEEMKSAFGNIRPLGFIQKPYTPAQLLDKTSNILAKKY